MASDVLKDFNRDAKTNHTSATVAEFQARVMKGEQTGGLPPENDERLMAEFLLPRIIQETTDIAIMKQMTAWLDKSFPQNI